MTTNHEQAATLSDAALDQYERRADR